MGDFFAEPPRKRATPRDDLFAPSPGPLVAFVGDTVATELHGGPEDLLARIIGAMGPYAHDCRRLALGEEIRGDLGRLGPRFVVALGGVATGALLGGPQNLGQIHGQFFLLPNFVVMPLFHPEYLKACPSMKKVAWHDLKNLLRLLGGKIP